MLEEKENNILTISKILMDKRKNKEKESIDLKASHEAITICLKYLEMNQLKQLSNLKNSMKKVLKTLEKND